MISLSLPQDPRSLNIVRKLMRTDEFASHTGALSLTLWITGCSAAPAQDLLGSFFPAWMLCAVIGVLAAVVLRLMLTWVGIAEDVPMPSLTYVVLATALTLLVWLLWFGH